MNTQSEADLLSPERAWAPYEPSAERPWDLRRAAHLYRRGGLGANWSQLQQALGDGPARTIDRLLRPAVDLAEFNATFEDYAVAAAGGGSTESLRAWWLRRMIQTPHPLLERMTLFWHSHFAIGNAGVNSAALMARHIQCLRDGALAGYRPLLQAVMDEPALSMWLQSATNRKSNPNPNVARQLLHVYGPGPEGCDERDVEQTARALTGRAVLRNELRFFEREFDDGSKTLLGQTGNWTAGDAVRIVLDHPATALGLVRKLYAWFISESEQPRDEILAPLAADLRAHDNVLQVIETMLRSDLFFSPRAWRQRIKSPVELAVGLVRAMEANVATLRLAQDLAELGQDLYQPPTSSGWPGGRCWLNQATLIGRHNLATALLADAGPYEGRLNPRALAEKYAQPEADGAAMLRGLLLQDETRARELEGNGPPDLRQLATAWVLAPEFQLN